jgi:hypothetical protein
VPAKSVDKRPIMMELSDSGGYHSIGPRALTAARLMQRFFIAAHHSPWIDDHVDKNLPDTTGIDSGSGL